MDINFGTDIDYYISFPLLVRKLQLLRVRIFYFLYQTSVRSRRFLEFIFFTKRVSLSDRSLINNDVAQDIYRAWYFDIGSSGYVSFIRLMRFSSIYTIRLLRYTLRLAQRISGIFPRAGTILLSPRS